MVVYCSEWVVVEMSILFKPLFVVVQCPRKEGIDTESIQETAVDASALSTPVHFTFLFVCLKGLKGLKMWPELLRKQLVRGLEQERNALK